MITAALIYGIIQGSFIYAFLAVLWEDRKAPMPMYNAQLDWELFGLAVGALLFFPLALGVMWCDIREAKKQGKELDTDG